MACIKKRGKAWRVIVKVDGLRRERSVRCSHKDAKRLGTQMERELAREAKRKRAGQPGVVQFSEMLDRYEADKLPTKREATQVSYRNSIAAMRIFFVDGRLGNPRLDDVDQDHIDMYLTWRRLRDTHGEKLDAPLSERSREKEWAILHKLFGIARRLGWREGPNPVDFVDKPEPEDREPILLDYEQTEKLLAECRKSKNPMLYLYVLTLLETGVRCNSECLWIKWGDVDLDKGRIFIRSSYRHSTKSGKSRHVSMPPRLREAMRDHFAKCRFLAYDGQQSEWVFHHPIDNRTAKAGERIKSMYCGYKQAAKRAELDPDLRQHDLRHLWVTLSLADGVPLANVRDAAGHADYATTDRYANMNPDQYLAGFEQRYSTDAKVAENG
jgi:integrase